MSGLHLLELIRPRTLLLSIAVMLPGNAMAAAYGAFSALTFALMLLTTIGLQSLSNIANDYGDGIRGTDEHRSGPRRLVASGILGVSTAKHIMMVCAILTLLSGALLIAISVQSWAQALDFMVLGIIAILAAIGYTVGRYAYGYYGLGEVAVFLFFGLLAVCGSYYLQTAHYSAPVWLIAIGCGLLAATVLHINNLRDIETDHSSGKHTIAVCLGWQLARWQQLFMMTIALLCYACYAIITNYWFSLLWLLALPLIIKHLRIILRAKQPAIVGKELKAIVQINLWINALFALGHLFV
ncbi:1,4-dihydroxy-2-naphthoate octaprenyltransferase [Suttonella sp. R2A3]|uniref:1,4-dihydroxy-2-naphthoate octaprenyltransferase n=1 Tax=Suttonella sp. R2A3 TaxID=2908648 RepID=UPI001F475191|nr:1,4-dihydroxy-2-naphthoate octaprenyltransferase [Suttonella sp. R2A3]UJF24152.1 1,4-dihydroxy-2-naphthoate octaprenyltransferase [Suttonella sp. R2A3]